MLSYPWLKLYNETIYDPKIRSLSIQARWLWITCLCLSSASPVRGELRMGSVTSNVIVTLRVVTDASHMSQQEVESAMSELVSVGLISVNEYGAYCISNWSKRQAESASNAERQRRFREKRKGQDRNEVTLPVTLCNAIDIRSKKLDKESISHSDTSPRKKKSVEEAREHYGKVAKMGDALMERWPKPVAQRKLVQDSLKHTFSMRFTSDLLNKRKQNLFAHLAVYLKDCEGREEQYIKECQNWLKGLDLNNPPAGMWEVVEHEDCA